jgi:hypothetical protein
VRLAGEQQETLGGRVFFECDQAGATCTGLARVHLRLTQGQPRLELVAHEAKLSSSCEDRLETSPGLGGFAPCGEHASGLDAH